MTCPHKLIAAVSRAMLVLLLAATVGCPHVERMPPPLHADNADSPVLARVGGRAIRQVELDRYVAVYAVGPRAREGAEELSPEARREYYRQRRAEALDELVDRHAVLAKAHEEFMTRPGMDKVIEDIVLSYQGEMERRHGSWIAFRDFLRVHGLTPREWRRDVRDDVLVSSYLDDRVQARVHVSPAEMHVYYEGQREDFRLPAQLRYRMILVDTAGCRDAADEEARARALLKRLRAGEDFAALADKHSLDRTRHPGGLHVVPLTGVNESWRPKPCRGMEPGQTSDVVRVAGGPAIVRFEGIRQGRVRSFDEVQTEIAELLERRKTAEERRKLIAEIRAETTVRLAEPPETFPAAP